MRNLICRVLAALILAAATGCRIKEIGSAEWSNLAPGRISASESTGNVLSHSGQSSEPFREVPLDDGTTVRIPEAAARAIEKEVAKRQVERHADLKAAPKMEKEREPSADIENKTARNHDDVRVGDLPSEQPSVRRPVDRYELQPGDRLEFMFTESYSPDVEYRLAPGDEIRVEYLHLGLGEVGPQGEGRSPPSTLDRNVRLQPDGRISLPYLETVPASGRTVSALADVLNERYRKFYVEPRMHVSLLSTGSGLRDLREGQIAAGSRLVEVGPDGRIQLPWIGAVAAARLSVEELQREVAERFRAVQPTIAPTVRLVRTSTGHAGR